MTPPSGGVILLRSARSALVLQIGLVLGGMRRETTPVSFLMCPFVSPYVALVERRPPGGGEGHDAAAHPGSARVSARRRRLSGASGRQLVGRVHLLTGGDPGAGGGTKLGSGRAADRAAGGRRTADWPASEEAQRSVARMARFGVRTRSPKRSVEGRIPPNHAV